MNAADYLKHHYPEKERYKAGEHTFTALEVAKLIKPFTEVVEHLNTYYADDDEIMKMVKGLTKLNVIPMRQKVDYENLGWKFAVSLALSDCHQISYTCKLHSYNLTCCVRTPKKGLFDFGDPQRDYRVEDITDWVSEAEFKATLIELNLINE